MRDDPHPLSAYLAASQESLASFAARADVDVDRLEGVLAGRVPDLALARRLAAASGGAVTIPTLGLDVVDAAPRVAPLNAALLSAVIEVVAPDRFAPDSDASAHAAEAAANIFVALAGITDRSRADRLAEALRPALQESGARSDDPPSPGAAARRAARLYFAAEARLTA
ncbi:MAG: hypothetical protein K2Q06_01770 [Parvularculaceae bacterium]|nr:hypothetical protein [Parvularculaceae bacterium]